MTAAEIKRELSRRGFVAQLSRAPGGFDYQLRTKTGMLLAEGWSAGNKTDALSSAYEAAIRIKR